MKRKPIPKRRVKKKVKQRQGNRFGGILIAIVLLFVVLAGFAIFAKNSLGTTTYEIHISRSDQTMTVYGNARILRTIAVSTGRLGDETPPGRFTVQSKQRYKRSNIFCLADDWSDSYRKDPAEECRSGYQESPMSFGIQYNGAYWLHAGPMAGRPTRDHGLSAGCTRMVFDDAQWLFERIPVGTVVVIT